MTGGRRRGRAAGALLAIAAGTAALLVAWQPDLARSQRASAVPAPGSFRQNDLGVDPSWEGRRNRSTARCVARKFAFGWRATTFASTTAGEVGGRFERTSRYRAFYAEPLSPERTLDDRLSMSATVRVPSPNGGGVLLGWFSSTTSYGWRTPDFLGVRINGEATKARLYAEYGTANTFAPGQLVDTGVVLGSKTRYRFTLDYFPGQGDYGSGLLRLTVDAPGAAPAVAETSLPSDHRADGATFDRFGLLNVQLDGRPMTAYVGDLVLDGAPVDLSSPPGWDAVNTALSGRDCLVHDRQDFGYSGTSYAGGAPGEVGGVVWRSVKRPSSYADRTASLTLDDELYAEGRIDLEGAAPDSDLLVGWFSAASELTPAGGDLPTNLLAAVVGGPTARGYRAFPAYHGDGDVRGVSPDSALTTAPMLTPAHHPWEWWICYRPNADLAGNGRITVGLLDPAGQLPTRQAVLTVPARARAAGARFDHFGIRNLELGGHDLVVYLDDLRYTVGPGDSGPDERCDGS